MTRCRNNDLSEWIGKTIEHIKVYSDEIRFFFKEKEAYRMRHQQECCEDVYIEDVCGDWNDLIGIPLKMAEEVSSYDAPPPKDEKDDEYVPSSYTWTFYKFATEKGYVTIRWFGTSNGFYSEDVNIYKITDMEI